MAKTIGGYVARRFGNLRFDAALSCSNVGCNADAGTAAGAVRAVSHRNCGYRLET
jgi:hypothetical protein